MSTCDAQFVRWDGTDWSCDLEPDHGGDHYSGDDVAWTWWGGE